MDTYSANIIAENLFAQVDTEGRQYQVISEIIDHRKNSHEVSIDDAFIADKYGNQHRRKTTMGWEMLIRWKGGTTSWVKSADVTDLHPIEVAEYAIANKIVEQPAFAWWAKQALKKRDRHIKKAKSRYRKWTHTFGVELPKTVAEAYAIDQRTSSKLWTLAVAREMLNVRPAFKFVDDDVIPAFWKPVGVHMIFDVKMDLTRKARLVANGHETEVPTESTYSTVVTRDSVRLAFLLAALNGLDVLAGDVQNAYINAESKENLYIQEAGPECGPGFIGRPCMIVRALYGLKSSWARWHDHMAQTLRDLAYKTCIADHNVWMKPKVKHNGEEYWEYVLIYSDDILVVSHDPLEVMNGLTKVYTLKEGSVAPPKTYLGADVQQHTFMDAFKFQCVYNSSVNDDSHLFRSVSEITNVPWCSLCFPVKKMIFCS
jgi:Reverse transcriptase (RNA-dependent DNA polymerase)